ncbi:proline-rich protein 2-like [Panthera tigris]|uniref:proline-rich protein 2-like n=1 Tax=Panthera tigris TaxID=9694 RepID=UPI001C6F8031|nr:proline-rich protein 2-like [Panthera tigris]
MEGGRKTAPLTLTGTRTRTLRVPAVTLSETQGSQDGAGTPRSRRSEPPRAFTPGGHAGSQQAQSPLGATQGGDNARAPRMRGRGVSPDLGPARLRVAAATSGRDPAVPRLDLPHPARGPPPPGTPSDPWACARPRNPGPVGGAPACPPPRKNLAQFRTPRRARDPCHPGPPSGQPRRSAPVPPPARDPRRPPRLPVQSLGPHRLRTLTQLRDSCLPRTPSGPETLAQPPPPTDPGPAPGPGTPTCPGLGPRDPRPAPVPPPAPDSGRAGPAAAAAAASPQVTASAALAPGRAEQSRAARRAAAAATMEPRGGAA